MRYYVHIETGNEHDLEAAVATEGPIAVIVDASHNLFRVYVMYTIIYTIQYMHNYVFVSNSCTITCLTINAAVANTRTISCNGRCLIIGYM